MPSSRFIKYIPSERAKWLRQYHPNLYLLLSLASERAKRTTVECPLGLLQGDAILGSFEEAGLTRKKYRNAIAKGIELKIWEIVWNFKNPKHQKRAIKGAIRSIVVNIIDNTFWDINLEEEIQQGAIKGANNGPLKGHKQESEEAKNAFARKESDKEKIKPLASSPLSFSPFLEKEKEQDLEDLWVYIREHVLEIGEKSLRFWISKWGNKRVLETMKLMRKRNAKHHEKWMQKALQEDWAVQQQRIINNYQFAKDFKEAFNWHSLHITKQYCTDQETQKDFQFFLPENEFADILQTRYKLKKDAL